MSDDLASVLEQRKLLPGRTRTGNYTKKRAGGYANGVGLFECPYCGNTPTRIVQTYRIGQGPDYHRYGFQGVTRRRECATCGQRFTTHEKSPVRENLLVVKRDGSREPWDREKMVRSIKMAMADRMIAKDRLHRIGLSIEANLQPKLKNGDNDNVKTRFRTVTTQEIGALVLNTLKEIDKVAYVRFASIFMRFQSLDYFEHLLVTLRAPPIELS